MVYYDVNIRDLKILCYVRTAVVSAGSRWHKSGLLLRRLGCNTPHHHPPPPTRGREGDSHIRIDRVQRRKLLQILLLVQKVSYSKFTKYV
jgi:hypothetical protein